MKFTVQKTTQKPKEHDLLVIAAFKQKSEMKKAGPKTSKKSTLDLDNNLAQDFDKKLGGHLLSSAQQEGFLGDEGQFFVMNTLGKLPATNLALFGLGDSAKQTIDLYRRAGGELLKYAQRKRATSVGIIISEQMSIAAFDVVQALAEGMHSANYCFDTYLTRDKKENYVKNVNLYLPTQPSAELKVALTRANELSKSVHLARDLINEGPMVMTPQNFARHAEEVAEECGLTIDILDEKRLKKERMNLMLAVASASSPTAPCRLVRLHYKPKKPNGQRVALVGKGVMFDSGGLDIKTTEGMLEMKYDMAGAAAVLGTLRAVAKLEPRTEVVGYMACVENGVGPLAYHPGDILVSRKGLTIDINNTDAEGRLILADTISYAIDHDKPDIVIDVATLTAACAIALGPKTAGVFTNDDHLHDVIVENGVAAGESFWRMPLTAALKEALRSPFADMKNTGERYGGAITAALFLQEFVEPGVKWAHLDIAGPGSNAKPHPYLNVGGVGFGIRTLAAVMMAL